MSEANVDEASKVGGLRQNLTSVLVLEDDDADYIAIERHLNSGRIDYLIVRAKTVDQAKYEISNKKFDVGLIDYQLGIESGVEFIESIGGQDAPLATVLLTGYEQHDVDVLALEAGAYDFVKKNSMTRELLHRVIRYAVQRHKTNTDLKSTRSELQQIVAARELFLVRVCDDLSEIAELVEKVGDAAQSNAVHSKIESLRAEAAQHIKRTIANCHHVNSGKTAGGVRC